MLLWVSSVRSLVPELLKEQKDTSTTSSKMLCCRRVTDSLQMA